MNRYLFILISLIFSFAGINAQELMINNQEGYFNLYLFMPFSQYILSPESTDTHYQLSLNVIDADKNSVYQNIYDIVLKREMIIDGASQVFLINKTFLPGSYRMVTSLRNVNLGDKQERQYGINIQNGDISTLRDIIIAENADLFYCPSSLEQISADLKSCYLYLETAAEKDSIIISALINEEKMRIKVTTESNNRIDLLPFMESGPITSLEIIYYAENIADKRELYLYQSFDKYNQLFSKKDQLKQIKYVANQNEWKELSKLAEKDINAAIDMFWEKHNNSPGYFKNDVREMFYERVMNADELYTIHKKLPGWKSDRGRIFIIKGPPDEIMEESFPIGKHPYIEWHYYKENLVYLFIDKSGYGNFKLEGVYYEN